VSHASTPDDAPPRPQVRTTPPTDQELLTTLFDLGRQVTAVLDLDELLQKIPGMIARLVDFQAFAAYLLDEKRGELRIAHAVGYPPETAATLRLKVGQGLVGTAVAESRSLLVDDVRPSRVTSRPCPARDRRSSCRSAGKGRRSAR
jgi:hypothetical protein